MHQHNEQRPNVQGSDADRAAGGLDVEASFAELDQATDTRLGREARSQQANTADQVASPKAQAPGGKGSKFGES